MSVPAGLFHQKMSLVLRPMFQVLVLSVMNFSYQLSLYTSDVNLQCLLDCVIRYRNKCFWCCDRCSRSQYRHADIQEIITIVGTIFSQVLM
ncbi:uncharacterized protein [Dysidea avara]|uniref:uncharacterized protein isoform X3 n=1 Tax=Dysidea avara TaxID=196820 RepID=UPI00332267B2